MEGMNVPHNFNYFPNTFWDHEQRKTTGQIRGVHVSDKNGIQYFFPAHRIAEFLYLLGPPYTYIFFRFPQNFLHSFSFLPLSLYSGNCILFLISLACKICALNFYKKDFRPYALFLLILSIVSDV